MTVPARFRLEADYVVTIDDARPVIPGGVVDVGVDGRIVGVGTRAELGEGPTPRRVGGLLMPGLVNAHAHTPMTLVRSAGDGLTLHEWLTDAVWPLESRMTPEDSRAGMRLGSMEMLLAGVTTSCEMYRHEEMVVAAARDTGARLVITPGVIAGLSDAADLERRIDALDAFHREYDRPEEGITVGYAPHSLYDLSPQLCGEIAARARAAGSFVHIHLEETRQERELVLERWGRSATKLLADAGVFEGPTLLAHGVWLDDTDLALLGASPAAVAHCPQSNLKLGSGIARVGAMRRAGITVGIGTDGPASNDNLDLWEELRLTPLLARGTSHDPRAMPADVALRLATRDGALAVGLDDVGVLRPGAWADLIRVDLDHPSFCPFMEDRMLTQLVFSGASQAVTDVWVGGRTVVVDGEIGTVDRHEVMADARRRAAGLARRT
ncbi:MAG: amidohydrolase family protein [Acidimicrobiales bacterium]